MCERGELHSHAICRTFVLLQRLACVARAPRMAPEQLIRVEVWGIAGSAAGACAECVRIRFVTSMHDTPRLIPAIRIGNTKSSAPSRPKWHGWLTD